MPGADRESTRAPGGVTAMPVPGGVAAMRTAGAVRAGTEPAAGAAPRGSPSARLHRGQGPKRRASPWVVVSGRPRKTCARDTPLGVREASIRRSVADAQPGHTRARQPNNAGDPTLAVWLDTCAARMQPAIDKPRFSPLKF